MALQEKRELGISLQADIMHNTDSICLHSAQWNTDLESHLNDQKGWPSCIGRPGDSDLIRLNAGRATPMT